MSTATLSSPAADDSDLIAAFADLRTARVLPRPGFVAELRARLLAEVFRLGPKRTEVTPYATTDVDDAPGVGLRGVCGPAEGDYHGSQAGRNPGQPTGGGQTARAAGAGE